MNNGMTLADKMAAALHREEAANLISLLTERGIDLDFAYQWHRAEAVRPFGHIQIGWNHGNNRWFAQACNLRDESDRVDRQGDTPAAALSALADGLEARRP